MTKLWTLKVFHRVSVKFWMAREQNCHSKTSQTQKCKTLRVHKFVVSLASFSK